MTTEPRDVSVDSHVAIHYGALDVSRLAVDQSVASVAILPTVPSEPIVIAADVAALWLRLVAGPVARHELTPDERRLVDEFEVAGIASRNTAHPARATSIAPPWLSSYAHELVYALIASVARDHGVSVIAIKGPVLYAQGLRPHEHSGDVDIWVAPNDVGRLVDLLGGWGWTRNPSVFAGTALAHSVALTNDSWGCEIDVHYRFPGVGASDDDGFATLIAHVDTQTFAGVASLSPSLGAHSVIHALHLIRPLGAVRPSASNLSDAVRALQYGDAGALEVATAWKATGTLRNELTSAFPSWNPSTADPVPPAWLWRTEPTTARAYLSALRLVPWSRRLAVLRELLWPERSAAAASAMRAGRVSRGTLRDRIGRLRRGIRQLRRPRAAVAPTAPARSFDHSTFDHVIVTRFSVRFTENQAPATDAWLRERWRIFTSGTLSSVGVQSNRHLTWLVFFDTSAPQWLRDVVDEAAPGVFTPVWLDHPWSHAQIRDSVENVTSAPWLITTRLDSDDLVAPHFVATIHDQFAGQELLYVNLLRGLQVDANGFMYRYDYPSNPFISLIERRTSAPPRTVFASFRHGDSNRLAEVREVVTAPLWIQVVHGGNVSNDIRGLTAPMRTVDDSLREAASHVIGTRVQSAPRWSSTVRLVRLWARSPGHLRTFIEARAIVGHARREQQRSAPPT